ncbi:SCO6880 family protein [Ornithinimicrobium sp. LYQ92]|uniref:SCO6880 family protein n=1 Tax=Serinicoccus sp. LYQ92 TaxID=3378798 RepID=UPI003851F871
MVATEADKRPPTYGNWRRPDKGGLGNFSTLGTLLLVLGPVVMIVLFLSPLGWQGALVWILFIGILLGLLAIRDKHYRTVLHHVGAGAGYAFARMRGRAVARTGPLSRVPYGRHTLPGLLAQSELSEHRDSFGLPFGMVHIPATRSFTIIMACEPDGMSLVDQEHINQRVAQWGGWLAALGHEPGLEAATVTIETAPDSGSRLRREVGTNLQEDAPALAVEMFGEVMDTYPEGSASVKGYVALTYKGDGRRRRDADAVARELASRLPSLRAGLSGTGAGVAVPMTAQEICELVRVAYDPAAAGILERAAADGQVPELSWDDCGPVTTAAAYDSLVHDSGRSRTWEMTLPPRGEVYSDVLYPLLAPISEVTRKRVTMHYRPYEPGRAARVVESDRDRAAFRVTSASRASARVKTLQRAAEQTATEEARGAGLVNVSLLVTATVPHDEGMADAAAVVESISASSRVQLRPVYGAQDSAFAAALPLGLLLDKHTRVPSDVRGML